jgi:hypothetical protein
LQFLGKWLPGPSKQFLPQQLKNLDQSVECFVAKKMKIILKGTIFLEFGMEVTELSGTWETFGLEKRKINPNFNDCIC